MPPKLETRDDRFGEGIVVGISRRSHRGLDAALGEPLAVADGQILEPAKSPNAQQTEPGSASFGPGVTTDITMVRAGQELGGPQLSPVGKM
jgi:hypothetical protein